MKYTPALAVLPLVGLLQFAFSPQDGDVAAGRRVFLSRCASCHFIPDQTIQRDKLWVQMINTTA